MAWGRRRRLPADDRPPLDRDERVVAWAAAGDSTGAGGRGAVVVATDRGLWLPEAGGPRRVGWHEIHKATWDGTVLAVTGSRVVEDNDGWTVVADVPTVVFRLPDPGDLPRQVHSRVTRSVGPSTHHPLPGEPAGVRVVGRRVPGRDGLAWTVRYDPGVDHDDPVVREVTAGLVAQARAAG